MRITSDVLDQTINRNKEIKQEIERMVHYINTRYKEVNILSPEKQALQILKEHHLIQLPIKDEDRSEEHTSELQSRGHLVCRLLLEKKNNTTASQTAQW